MPSLRSVLKKLETKKYISKEDLNEAFERLDNHDKAIRNKTIDEFAEKLCDRFTDDSMTVMLDGIKADILTLDATTEIIFELAEELKEGVKNE